MEDVEMLKALLETTSHLKGTEFSDTCIKLLDRIIETTRQKEQERIALENQIAADSQKFITKEIKQP